MGLFNFLKFKSKDRTLIECNSKKENIIIPGSFSSISSNAFVNCGAIHVVVKEGVTTLKDLCFSGMKNLKIIQLPDTISGVGERIFYGDENLEEVTFPNNYREVGFEQFFNCYKLTTLNHTLSLEVIKDRAFYNCYNLSRIDYLCSLMTIGKEAFANSGIRELNLAHSAVKNISYGAFSNCLQLYKVTLNSFLKEIGEEAFANCKRLEFFQFGQKMEKIGNGAFKNTSLRKVFLTNTIKEIGEEAFSGCKKITVINLPNEIEHIQAKCFFNCSSIKAIYLPLNIKIIDEDAFNGCSSIKEIVIPKSVKYLKSNCFANCHNLRRVVIENDDVDIAENAFYNCNNIEEVIYKGKIINIKNLSITNLNKEIMEKLINDEGNLEKIRAPIHIESLKLLEKESLLTDFYHNAYYKNYRRLYERLFANDLESIEEKKSLFLIAYTLGVFNPSLTQKSSELLYDFIENGLLKKEELQGLVQGLTLKPVDEKMVTTITDRRISFLQDCLIHSRVEKGFLGKCLEEYENVQATNTTNKGEHKVLKPTVEKFINYFNKEKFKGIENQEEFELALELGKFFDKQSTFDKAKSVLVKFKEANIEESLISEEVRKETYNRIRMSKVKFLILNSKVTDIFEKLHYEFLKKSDPVNFTIGKYCSSCCAHIEGIGEGLCFASILDEDTQTLVISNSFGEILSKATFTINKQKETIVINSIQINNSLTLGHEMSIVKKYLDAFKIFVEDYNKNHKNQLNKINLATNKSSLVPYFPVYSRNELCASIDYSQYGIDHEYMGDWNKGQICIYDNFKYK